ncbi:hypothetical protein LX36DRAFT_289749 [Colletotrichum falcatum]|nr:hypothetical protein LX36DRAFT_289749 [Colletotrichum falcatum]
MEIRNLVACYLGDRPWAQDMLRKPSRVGGCAFCREWATSDYQRTDCSFLTMPPADMFGSFADERSRVCRWLQRLTAGFGMFPQCPTPIDDYIGRVADYSRRGSLGGDPWPYERIVDTLKEAKSRAEGRQLNCWQLLGLGLDNTLRRLGHDWFTAAAGVGAFLTPVQAAELHDAIQCDARSYYLQAYIFDADGRCAYRLPRPWVLNQLQTMPPPAPIAHDNIRWRQLLPTDRVWPMFWVQGSEVFVWIQYREAGHGSWLRRWVGRLDDDGSELSALVRFNAQDERAMRMDAELRQEQGQQRAQWHGGRDNEAGGGRADDRQAGDSGHDPVAEA